LTLQFTKFHGAGNDFILLDASNDDIADLDHSVIEWLCDRHFGIGADGLIILKPSGAADFKMVYYNADGKPGTMCGNGGRCITAFAHRQGITGKECRFEASDGMHTGELLDDGNIRISLNDVTEVKPMDDGYYLNTGSPHFITIREDIDNLDVFAEGQRIRNDPRFAEGTNVNFLEATKSGIKVRTYERGVEDETLSCGTGVTASAIAAQLHFASIHPPVEVETLGGLLTVDFVPGHVVSGVFLTGPAKQVFEGTIEIPGV
jgi:diaminopimelate epimerase